MLCLQPARWTDGPKEAVLEKLCNGKTGDGAYFPCTSPCWTYHRCTRWKYKAWHPDRAGLQSAEMPLRISQRLGEFSSKWQLSFVLCSPASSSWKNKVWEHGAVFDSAMQTAAECAGEDPRVFIKFFLKNNNWEKKIKNHGIRFSSNLAKD